MTRNAVAAAKQLPRSHLIGMASETCIHCEGTGTRLVYRAKVVACNCVFRAIFRACLARFSSNPNRIGSIPLHFKNVLLDADYL